MNIALTLVVNPKLTTSLDQIETKAIKALGISSHNHSDLAANHACDLLFTYPSVEDAAAKVTDTLNAVEGLDWALQPAEGRKKKLLLADMDSTMIPVECVDELADFVGLKEKVSAITEAAMRGELNFESALTERVALLEGLTQAQLADCYKDRISLMAGAKTLIHTMKANGAYTALVSGGFTYFTTQVARAIGFDMDRANILEMENDALTGKVAMPICGANTKLETLKALAAERGLSRNDILAVGDGANDIPMIEAAGLGVAYHAKPKTQASASAAVRYGDLTSLLYFQGYKDSDFIA
ncbi:MAG: phosphoserine phosphatase SerB [Kordiimonadaceae bacterium]|nr:phosphoserine phosphatase SerB [Kordiimonadaceae bacterium]